MITSAYSKSSISSGFNSILEKFYEMIREIIVFKYVCGIFFIFCWSSFINNLIVKNYFSETWNDRNLNISKPIGFLKNSAHRFEDHVCTNKVEGKIRKISKKFFSRTWSFFRDCKTTELGLIFSHKKSVL